MFTLHNADCLAVMAGMSDQSIDLVATDPPYFRVKDAAWDNQWANRGLFLDWLETCVREFARLLRPHGGLYLFASAKMASSVEMVISRHMQVENHLVWIKPSGMHCRQNRASLRRYFPATERIIFATPKGQNDNKAEHAALAQACGPIINYLRHAQAKAGLSQADVNKALNTQMAGHWFGRSQWRLPTKDQYRQLQELFRGWLPWSYDSIKAEHDRLRASAIRRFRRPFDVAGREWYTDAWVCPPVPYRPGKHPCEKPLAIMEHIITASTEAGAVVFDPFAGSGTTGVAALRTGRQFEGCELDPESFDQATTRMAKVLAERDR